MFYSREAILKSILDYQMFGEHFDISILDLTQSSQRPHMSPSISIMNTITVILLSLMENVKPTSMILIDIRTDAIISHKRIWK